MLYCLLYVLAALLSDNVQIGNSFWKGKGEPDAISRIGVLFTRVNRILTLETHGWEGKVTLYRTVLYWTTYVILFCLCDVMNYVDTQYSATFVITTHHTL